MSPPKHGSGQRIGQVPRPAVGWLAGLIAFTLVAYLPLWRAGFIWDDDSMLTGNRLVWAGDGLYRFWFTTQAADYWPVTYTTLWLEWRLWGENPLGYHLTNLVLHLAGVGLLWAVLRRLRVPGAWWAALLMGVHPLNVESVTWIAQRKNLLAMLFYLASIWCFLVSQRPSSRTLGNGGPVSVSGKWYWLSLLAFILAMLSKGSVATLPLILTGLILWHRRLTSADIFRLVPFFAVAAVLGAVDVWFQHLGDPEVIRQAGFLERLLGAGAILWFYLYHSFWPATLVFVYPAWQIDGTNLVWWLPGVGIMALTGTLLWLARDRPPGSGGAARAALFSWGYFCVMLLPVLGFTDVYFMKYSLVADHYAHLALIGVVAWAAFAGHTLWERSGKTARPAVVGLALVAVGLLAWRTWNQNRIFRDDLTLFQTTVAQNPNSWMAHAALGRAYLRKPEQSDRAIAELQEALRLKPDYALAHNNLGHAWSRTLGKLNEAVAEYRAALRLNPNLAVAHLNLGDAWALTPGRRNDAISEYQQALRLEPDFALAHCALGVAWLQTPGRLNDAIGEFEEALRLQPDYAAAHFNLAITLLTLPNRTAEAAEHLQTVLRIQPGNDHARQILAQLTHP